MPPHSGGTSRPRVRDVREEKAVKPEVALQRGRLNPGTDCRRGHHVFDMMALDWRHRMVVAFNETSVAAQPIDAGVARQRLLTPERVKDTSVLLDRFTLAAGASVRFEPSATSL